ncbi:adenine-specific DNA methyltransferase [Clostridium sp. CAG:967]|nr:adenine-specific DNA methyltransferase [Clostridium sp. CAG:967]
MCKETKIKLGKRIKYLRERNNISVKELSEKSGISKSHLIRIEKGLVNSALFTVAKISIALKVKLHELFDL